MIIFVLNYLASAIEIIKPAKTLRGIVIPSLFFSILLSTITDCLAVELVALAFCLKFLCGGFRVAAQELTDRKETVFYFFTLIETIVLWWFLNPLI